MPPAIYTQNVIALIWDFDKTLTHGYMQEPLFAEFGVEGKAFEDDPAIIKKYKALTRLRDSIVHTGKQIDRDTFQPHLVVARQLIDWLETNV